MSVSAWHVYIIRCADDTLYTGIATDVRRRFGEHESQGRLCARYLRGRAPLQLVFTSPAGDRSSALRLEYQIKQLSRADKLALVSGEKRLACRDQNSRDQNSQDQNSQDQNYQELIHEQTSG